MLKSGILAGLLLAGLSVAQSSAPALLDILQEELTRNWTELQKKPESAPYFISYSVAEQQRQFATGTLGALQDEGQTHSRIFDVSVRVGSPKLDNYHSRRGERLQFTGPALLPVEDSAGAIQRILWQETDRAFRLASQRLINLKTSAEIKVAAEDESDDFSAEERSVSIGKPVSWDSGNADWAARVRLWSGEFKKYPAALASGVTVNISSETKYFVSTEGTRLRHGRNFSRITITARGKASDGEDLTSAESFEAAAASNLPKDSEVIAAVNRVGRDLTALLEAPVVEPFVGPAILSGRAAGVFFHEIFGHRIEGHRQKDETDGQTFTKRVNEQILPEFLSVVFDPTRPSVVGIDLNGSYLYDDEGVKARPVKVVEGGVLKTFLMSRSPVEGFSHSNGHGRRQPGREVVSRQSNLIVESARAVSEAKLRAMLMEEIKRQNKPYGFYFEQVTGGFTTTGRRGFQSFKVIPLIVYRVYPDGRPDELVRGVDIVGTPLASFAKILATSDKLAVFNGYCGAESGSVPVSAASPSILVSEIEIQKKERANDRPPLLPPPDASGGTG